MLYYNEINFFLLFWEMQRTVYTHILQHFSLDSWTKERGGLILFRVAKESQ